VAFQPRLAASQKCDVGGTISSSEQESRNGDENGTTRGRERSVNVGEKLSESLSWTCHGNKQTVSSGIDNRAIKS
jgi:hypothetical protein